MEVKEWDKICKECLDCSMYKHSHMKQKTITYKLGGAIPEAQKQGDN